jgi:hypothetical protein
VWQHPFETNETVSVSDSLTIVTLVAISASSAASMQHGEQLHDPKHPI